MIFPQHPTRVCSPVGLTDAPDIATMRSNTPAMPLNDAHSGGFFASGVCR